MLPLLCFFVGPIGRIRRFWLQSSLWVGGALLVARMVCTFKNSTHTHAVYYSRWPHLADTKASNKAVTLCLLELMHLQCVLCVNNSPRITTAPSHTTPLTTIHGKQCGPIVHPRAEMHHECVVNRPVFLLAADMSRTGHTRASSKAAPSNPGRR